MFSFVPRPRHNIGGSWQLWDRLLRLSHQGLRSLAGDPALSREASIRNAGSPGLQRQWREAHRTATSENASVWCGLTLEAFRGRRCASLSETGQGPDMGHEGGGVSEGTEVTGHGLQTRDGSGSGRLSGRMEMEEVLNPQEGFGRQ